jgi:hypothetical protein
MIESTAAFVIQVKQRGCGSSTLFSVQRLGEQVVVQ